MLLDEVILQDEQEAISNSRTCLSSTRKIGLTALLMSVSLEDSQEKIGVLLCRHPHRLTYFFLSIILSWAPATGIKEASQPRLSEKFAQITKWEGNNFPWLLSLLKRYNLLFLCIFLEHKTTLLCSTLLLLKIYFRDGVRGHIHIREYQA